MLEQLRQASFQLLSRNHQVKPFPCFDKARSLFDKLVLLPDMLNAFNIGNAIKAGGAQTTFGRIVQNDSVYVRPTMLIIG